MAKIRKNQACDGRTPRKFDRFHDNKTWKNSGVMWGKNGSTSRCVQVMKVIRAETLQLLLRFGELDATQVFAKKPAQWLGGVFPLTPLGWAALIRWSGKEGCQSGVAQNVLAVLSAYSANNHATSSRAAPSTRPRSGKKTPAARSF
jgi:hypothetical protein